MFAPQGAKPTWASITPQRSDPEAIKLSVHVNASVLGAAYLAAQQLNWTLLDRHSIARSLMRFYAQPGQPGLQACQVDHVHYVPYLNDEWNNVLLNMWCDA